MKQINLQENLRKKFKKKGVKMIAPETVFFSNDTKIGKNVTIEPYVVIGEKVKIFNNVKIMSFSHRENVKIENSYSRILRSIFHSVLNNVIHLVDVISVKLQCACKS